MIEDLEGATSEPVRRRHVLALSTAVATIALVTLVALVVPRERVAVAPQSGVPSASTPATPVDGRITLVPDAPMRVGELVCADGTKVATTYLIAVDSASSRFVAVAVDPRTVRPVPVLAVQEARAAWLGLSCALSDPFAPLLGHPTVAR
jgi:hypothetical protein